MRKEILTYFYGILLILSFSCDNNSAEFTERPRVAKEPSEVLDSEQTANKTVINKTFPTSKVEEGTFEATLDGNQIIFPLTHEIQYDKKKIEMTQVSRPQISETHKQGAAPSRGNDSFSQVVEKGLVDILIVVDTSGSMSQEQQNLSTKLEPLLNSIENSNWQIGVVTTDPADPCMRAVIKKGDANYTTAFATAINAGIRGSHNERGIQQAVEGLNCANSSWVRNNSSLAVLIISDEDNCSTGDCGTHPAGNITYLTDHITNQLGRKLGEEARVYGLIWHPADDTCTGAIRKAPVYASVIEATNGTYGSICSADYTNTLTRISADIAAILKNQFSLSQVPVPGEGVTVKVNGTAWTEFTIEGKTLTFKTAPPLSSTIVVSYLYGGDELKNSFQLSNQPAADALEVLVNGNKVTPTEFSVDTNKRLTFAKSPEPGSVISVTYKKDMPLITSVDVSPNAVPDSIKIEAKSPIVLNFDKTNGKLELNPPPGDGEVFSITYDNLIGPKLSYPLPQMPDKEEIIAVSALTNQDIEFSIKDDQIIFNEENFEGGQLVNLIYSLPEPNLAQELTLPFKPIEGSVSVSSEGECQIGNGIEIEGDKVKVNCELQERYNLIMGFKYDVSNGVSYDISDIPEPDSGEFRVMLGGNDLNFTRVGNSIELGEPPPLNETIELEFRY